MERARFRSLTGYKERHHVVPRCLGGTNAKDNMVNLTAEEHFVAHQLLVRIYPNDIRLLSAAIFMTAGPCGRVNNKMYGWMRVRFGRLTSLRRKGKPSHPHTPESKAKFRATRLGHPVSEETRQKLRIAHTGRQPTIEQRANMSAARLGKTIPPETRAVMSAAQKGHTVSAQQRANISATLAGVAHSAERVAKQAAGQLGLKASAETTKRRLAMTSNKSGAQDNGFLSSTPNAIRKRERRRVAREQVQQDLL